MAEFELLNTKEIDWSALDSFPDRTVFQTLPWLTFIARSRGAEPVVAALREDGATLGYFTGLMVRKFGMRILGSPFPGWTTDYMGFNLVEGVERASALAALERLAFGQLGCVHVELMDRRLTAADGTALGFECRMCPSYEIDLTRTEEELLAAMSTNARRYIRRAARAGLVIEEAHDETFADDYYAQLTDVFAKQGLVPTYGLERVRRLIECLHPTGMLLLLRARDTSGNCVATGIFPAFNDTMSFWGGASWRPFQHLHPNDPIQWYAMRYWKARGISRYDMSGGGDYKRKYGGARILVPWFRKSKYRVLPPLRNTAKRLVRVSQRVRAYWMRADEQNACAAAHGPSPRLGIRLCESTSKLNTGWCI